MRKFPFFVGIAIFSLFVSATAGAQKAPVKTPQNTPMKTPLNPGLWEITVTNQAPEKDAKRNMTSRMCYAAIDTENMQRVLPEQADVDAKCSAKDLKLDGAKAKWQLSCTSKTGTLTGPTNVTFGVDSYEGIATLTSQTAGKSSKVTQTIVGKRLSGC